MPKHGPFMLRAPHPSQASELYYQEPYDSAHYQTNCEYQLASGELKPQLQIFTFPSSSSSPAGSYYPPSLHPPHKPCMAQFLRSSNVPESPLPPPSSYPSDHQTQHPPPSASSGYPQRDRMGPPTFHPHPGQPQYGPLASTHGVYAPLYDSRRDRKSVV